MSIEYNNQVLAEEVSRLKEELRQKSKFTITDSVINKGIAAIIAMVTVALISLWATAGGPTGHFYMDDVRSKGYCVVMERDWGIDQAVSCSASGNNHFLYEHLKSHRENFKRTVEHKE